MLLFVLCVLLTRLPPILYYQGIMKNLLLSLCLFAISSLYGSQIPRAYLLGQFDPKSDSLFVVVPDAYSAKESTQYLRKEAMEAFIKMADAASRDGITLKIVSATRTFNAQKAIWEAKWKDNAKSYPKPHERARHILRYSSMPGTSRHHWGTDIDINSIENEYFASEQGKKEYAWLKEHASSYGFFQPYTAKDARRPVGYEEEEWHWSYAPISNEFTRQYNATIKYEDIEGFRGYETAKQLRVIANYVLGINQPKKLS